MGKGDDLLHRLIGFGLRLLSSQAASRNHLLAAYGGSAGPFGDCSAPNYAEARSGESLRNFVHNLGIVRKELNESSVWFRMLDQSGSGKNEQLNVLLKESDELCRIVAASRSTAGANARQQRKT